MSEKKEHIDHLTPEVIERYLKGELTHREMHEVEKLMLHSDFEAEAMEGLEAIEPSDIHEDLAHLKSRVDQKITKDKNPTLSFYLKIAASLLILVTSVYLIIELADESLEPETISQNKAIEPKEETFVEEKSSPLPEGEEEEEESIEKEKNIVDQPGPASEAAGQQANDEQKPEIEEAVTNRAEILTDAEIEAAKEPAQPEEIEAQDFALAEPEEDGFGEDRIAEVDIEAEDAAGEGLGLKGRVAGANTRKKKTEKNIVPPTTMRTALSDEYEKSVTGQVTDEGGKPLPGINVVVKGTTTGTVTDIDGNYRVEVPFNNNPALVFSFVGMESKEVEVGGRNRLDIEMSSDVTALSEVVVIAQGEEETYESTFDPAQSSIGKSGYKKYIEKNTIYPEGQDKKGKVVIKFKVNADGALSDFEVTKSMGEPFDQEAIRLIKEGPRWVPARRNDVPTEDLVKVRIKFEPPQ